MSAQPVAFLAVEDIHAITRQTIARQDVAVNVIPDGSGTGPRACHSAISEFTGEPVDFEIQQDLADMANRRSLKWIR